MPGFKIEYRGRWDTRSGRLSDHGQCKGGTDRILPAEMLESCLADGVEHALTDRFVKCIGMVITINTQNKQVNIIGCNM